MTTPIFSEKALLNLDGLFIHHSCSEAEDDGFYGVTVSNLDDHPMIMWIIENRTGPWSSPMRDVFYFRIEDDATLFKLRWG